MTATIAPLRPNERRVPCGICGGRGKVNPYNGAFSRNAGWQPERCFACCGRGYVVRGTTDAPPRAA